MSHVQGLTEAEHVKMQMVLEHISETMNEQHEQKIEQIAGVVAEALQAQPQPMSITDIGTDIALQIWASGGLWLVLALPCAMAIMNVLKPVMRDLIQDRGRRRLALFAMAYCIGFGLGMLLLTGPDRWKWSIFIGIINPVVYQWMLNRAIATNNLSRVASLKGRELVRKADGELSADETQSFINKRGNKE